MEMDGWTDRQTGDGRMDGLFVGWSGTGSLPSTFAPPDRPLDCLYVRLFNRIGE